MIPIITYNDALTQLCDAYDTAISPRKISRSNTNIIYLLLKAFAKGWEVINNVCASLSCKFNPKYCSDSDLESLELITGAERLQGSSTGLLVTAFNSSEMSNKVLLAGKYIYNADDNTVFYFELESNVTVAPQETYQMIMLSELVGSFPLTAQTSISLSAVSLQDSETSVSIDSDFVFSNSDNSGLLGYGVETNNEYRKRIIETTDRADVLTELKNELKNLPYVFDANVIYNNGTEGITYDVYTVPPAHMLIMISGIYKSELAEVVARYGLYPTVQAENSTELKYVSSVFAQSYYPVYVNPYLKTEYSVQIQFKADSTYIDTDTTETTIRTYLLSVLNTNLHTDYVTEKDVYDALEEADIEGVSILSVALYQNDVAVPYISVPQTRIPSCTAVVFL